MTIINPVIRAANKSVPKFSADFTTSALDSRVSFARSGNIATVVNASGFISDINADLPRFDHDPVTFACKGLLIEQASTNILPQSEFATGWYLSGASLASVSVANPRGTATSVAIVEDNSTGLHYAFAIGLSIITTGVVYTTSVYAKPNGRNFLEVQTSSTMGSVIAYFNLQTGAASNLSAGVSAKATPAGNGWFRCSVTCAATSTGTGQVYFITATAAGTDSYLGDGASGVLVFGAQVEVSDFATSYIPTTTTAETRNADIASITGTNFSGFWRAGKGSAVVRARPSTISGICPVVQFDDATADNIISLRGNTSNPELYVKSGGVDQAQIDAGSIVADARYRLSGAWATNSCAASFNSGEPVLDGVATIPTVTQARLGSDGTNYLNGHLEAIEYYDERIPNSALQVVSSTTGYRSIIGSVFRDAIIS